MSDGNATLMSFTGEKFEPCKVCGEPSSGWHCGAVTCEACKVKSKNYYLYLSIIYRFF